MDTDKNNVLASFLGRVREVQGRGDRDKEKE
jgi:hypothetical protein